MLKLPYQTIHYKIYVWYFVMGKISVVWADAQSYLAWTVEHYCVAGGLQQFWVCKQVLLSGGYVYKFDVCGNGM